MANPNFVNKITDLIKRYNPFVICLVETRADISRLDRF